MLHITCSCICSNIFVVTVTMKGVCMLNSKGQHVDDVILLYIRTVFTRDPVTKCLVYTIFVATTFRQGSAMKCLRAHFFCPCCSCSNF